MEDYKDFHHDIIYPTCFYNNSGANDLFMGTYYNDNIRLEEIEMKMKKSSSLIHKRPNI